MVRGRQGKKSRPSRTRRGLAAGPAGRSPATVSARWLTAGLYWWVTFTAVAGLALLIVTFLVVRDEVALDLHHGVALARVTEVQAGRATGTARVVFSAGGRQYRATVQQPLFGDGLEPGDQAHVDYLPSDPTVARRAGAHDLMSCAAVIGSVAFLALVPLFLRRKARTPRSRRRKRAPSAPASSAGAGA